MPPVTVAALLVLLLGCGRPFSSVQVPPRRIPANSTVQIWIHSREQIVHGASIRHDSLIGVNPLPSGPVSETVIAIPLIEIDSLRLMQDSGDQATGAFMAGFAIGAILLWKWFTAGN